MLTVSLLLCGSVSVTAEGGAPLFRFACMSDLHLDDVLIQSSHSNRDQFRTQLASCFAKGYTDLFLCAGDVSSYGSSSVWNEARGYIADAGYGTVLWALGNHGYGTTGINLNAQDEFMQFTGESSIYYHKIVNGYHFLCMAAEKPDTLVLLGQNVYGTEQVNWLARELADAAADSDGKPIFVVSHYPMTRNGVADALIPILTQYQNVIFIWGHEHSDGWVNYTLGDYLRTDQGFVNARAGCVQYGTADLADALLVDVYYDSVVLTYDRTEGNVLSPASVTVPLTRTPSWNVSYNSGRLYWYVPDGEDTRMIFCSYDELGYAVSTRIVTPMPNCFEHLDTAQLDGTTKVFFVDSQNRPVHEPVEFPVCYTF